MPPDIRTLTFAGSPLDRLNNHRHTTLPPIPHPPLYLVLSPTLDILHTAATATTVPTILFPHSLLQPYLPTPNPKTPPISLLGLHNGTPHYALPLPADFDSAPLLRAANARFRNLRNLALILPAHESAIAAHARALSEFHLRHLFCGLCGAPTFPDHFGSRRKCSRNLTNEEPAAVTARGMHDGTDDHCKGVWFPRTDPVAIMLVVHPLGDRILLGRQDRFPEGMYSCLAGFMEHGEGVEDSVRREVEEESGVKIGPVRFYGSQPWPFPYSLMLGCVAQALTEHIEIDANEVQEARWFTKAAVQEMFARGGNRDKGISLPPRMAIAGEMITAFAEGDPITVFEPRKPASGML